MWVVLPPFDITGVSHFVGGLSVIAEKSMGSIVIGIVNSELSKGRSDVVTVDDSRNIVEGIWG